MKHTIDTAMTLITPTLTIEQARAYEAEADKLIWIEDNIFPVANIQSSINTGFGERLANAIEAQFDLML